LTVASSESGGGEDDDVVVPPPLLFFSIGGFVRQVPAAVAASPLRLAWHVKELYSLQLTAITTTQHLHTQCLHKPLCALIVSNVTLTPAHRTMLATLRRSPTLMRAPRPGVCNHLLVRFCQSCTCSAFATHSSFLPFFVSHFILRFSHLISALCARRRNAVRILAGKAASGAHQRRRGEL
jgi:hypothetical protein